MLLSNARVAVVAAVLSGASLAGLPSSGSAAGGLDLGRDGVHWATTLDDPLFLPALAWRPGDERSSTFLVRNPTDTATDVRIEVARAVAASDPFVSMSLTTADDAGVEIGPGDELRLRVRDLEPGATTAVTLRAALSERAPDGVVVGADLNYAVEAVEAVEPAEGPLSSARLELAPVFLGLALIGTAGILSRRRSRQRTL